MKKINIQLLLTGNELMTGDIVDSNSAMIAEQLLSLGFTVQRKVTVADDLELLVEEITHITKNADILIINGGLGPTIDDLTAQALALATQVELGEQCDALKHLQSWTKKRGAKLDNANLKQAMLPVNANIIANRVGSAVGFKVDYQQCDIYCTPGVPHELNVMMKEQIIPAIQNKIPQAVHYKVTRFQVFGIGESRLQQLVTDKFPNWPKEVDLGFRAASPLLEVKLTIQNIAHESLLADWKNNIINLLGDHKLGEVTHTTPTMAEYVLAELNKQNKTITMAESCTGGLISSLLTNISGSSQVFNAGFVTYSNEMKSKMVKVSAQTLTQYGAVSEQVVIQMANGALNESGADYAIAVSGIAGPEGGTKDKPVGSVWVAWGHKSQIKSQYFCIKGNRQYFQTMVATRALDLIRRDLICSEEVPLYLS